jgi:hypothetical protein
MPPGVLRPMNPDEEQRWKAVKACISKGDKAKRKAEDFYIAAGQYLKELKAEHTGTWLEWEIKLKERAGLGKSRASELMAIADGRPLEQVRAQKAEVMRKLRAQLPPRGGENADEPTHKQPEKTAAKRPPKVQPGMDPGRDIINDALDLVARMDEGQRAEFFDLLMEKYGRSMVAENKPKPSPAVVDMTATDALAVGINESAA